MAGILLLLSLLGADSTQHVSGRLSVYAPGDGYNAGDLACGGRLTEEQVHVAVRDWRRRRCGSPVLVCAEATNTCVLATVQDAGPFGIYRGRLRRAVEDGRWKVWTKGRPPKGWKYRAVTDLSIGLWRALGKPRFLSRVHLLYLKFKRLPRTTS